MFIQLAQKLSFKHCLFPQQKPQLIDTGVLQNIEVNIFDLFLIEIVLNHVQNLFVLQYLFVAVQNLDIFAQDQLIGYFHLLKVVLYFVPFGHFLYRLLIAVGVIINSVEFDLFNNDILLGNSRPQLFDLRHQFKHFSTNTTIFFLLPHLLLQSSQLELQAGERLILRVNNELVVLLLLYNFGL